MSSSFRKTVRVTKMLMNFLHPLFDPQVECDVVCSDGYSINNLVSLDFRERSRGFLAAHFIKPPAVLLFQLPFPANVESMVIKPKVGCQISSGIAVLVAGIATNDKCIKKRDDYGHKATDFVKKRRKIIEPHRKQGQGSTASSQLNNAVIACHSYSLDITPSSAKCEHSSLFTQVAWLNDKEGKTVRIENKMFQQRLTRQGLQDPQTQDIQLEVFQRPSCLQKVTHVVLKIARLSGSSVPAIGKVEIWGQPSVNCKPEILEYALSIQEKIQDGMKLAVDSTERKPSLRVNGSNNHNLQPSLNCSKESIPEDFLDQITYELMTVPLLLPSGHNIDTVTLEKHIAAERSWGRMPSDPFTGKIFSDTSKPVPNSALKVRIDKFLLTSAINASGFGRSVGRNTNQLAERGDFTLKKDKEISFMEPRNCFGNKRRELIRSVELSSGRCEQGFVTSPLCSSNWHTEPTQELDHEEVVSKSLDSALHHTLQGLQMFTKKGKNVEKKPILTQASITQSDTDLKERRKRRTTETLSECIKKKAMVLCASCKRDLSETSIFLLPCQHIMCRSCLSNVRQQKNSFCKECKCKFKQSDVLRVHNK